MPQLDFSTYPSQIFWLVVGFLVLHVLMSKLFLPKIDGLLAKREEATGGSLAAAKTMQLQASELGLEVDSQYSAISAKSKKMLLDKQVEAGADSAKRLFDAEEAIAKNVSQKTYDITRAKNDAASSIAAASSDLASEISKKIAGI
jgi:F-type H+-transporting ATPase subunit b